jgi:phosphoribosylformylglycinamidine cyclo-ligase
MKKAPPRPTQPDRYAAAGVRLDIAEEAKRRIAELVRATRTPLARGAVGGFGGMVRVPDGYKKPVLVMSTDGVGSKVLVASATGIHDTVGEDLVNHSVNDILVHGATPVAFLDYIAAGTLVPEIAEQIVSGVARACRAHEMTLAGGETAQMPDLYEPGHYDLAGAIVGVVEEDKALHGDGATAGDLLIGYASTGLHTNGYTLARRIVFEWMKLGIDDPFPETGQTVGQVLLAVHRSYTAAVRPVLDQVHALAHVTGGGIAGNLVRVLPAGVEAVVETGSWPWPPVFRVLMRAGQVGRDEMRRVFNLGVGMIAVVAREDVEAAFRAAGRAQVEAWIIGEIRPGRLNAAATVRFEER